ncbi:hypothetical protein [Brevibacterium aurantiacum]|nr:hypothetical protein [Brevibacterium aurantiacum]
MTEDYGTATWRYWQDIRNDAGARGSFQDRPPMPVRARIEWERDGVEGVDGIATRLGFDGAIFVELKDRRCSTLGVWLGPDHVWWPGKQGDDLLTSFPRCVESAPL